jgi:hypothetical protein
MNRSSHNSPLIVLGIYLRAFGPLALLTLTVLASLFYFTYRLTQLSQSVTSGLFLITYVISLVLFKLIKKADENNQPIDRLSSIQVVVTILNAYLYVVCSTYLPWIINLIAVLLIIGSFSIIGAQIAKIETPSGVYKIKNLLTYSIILYILYYFVTITFFK